MVTTTGKKWSELSKKTSVIVSLKEFVDSLKYYKKTNIPLFIGASDLTDRVYVFLSNNDVLEIYKTELTSTPEGKKPDFSNMNILDGGNTLSFGKDYEVSVEWVLDTGISILSKKEENLLIEIRKKAQKYVEKTGTEYLSDLMVRCYVEGYLESHKNVKKLFSKSFNKKAKK